MGSCCLYGFPTTLLPNMPHISYIVTECNVSITKFILHKAQFTLNDSECERERERLFQKSALGIKVTQECIPVGCVPPASVAVSGVSAWGVSAEGGGCLLGWSGGVCPGGACQVRCLPRGVSTQGVSA